MIEPLFTKAPDKHVTAYDIFGKTHKRQLKNFKFRPSVYGLLIEDGKLLLKRHPLIDKFEFPGGGVEINETIEEALVREFNEETGILIRPKKLIAVRDSLFTFNDEDAHGILLFFMVDKISGGTIANGSDSVEVKYMDLKLLSKKNIQRIFWEIVKIIPEFTKDL